MPLFVYESYFRQYYCLPFRLSGSSRKMSAVLSGLLRSTTWHEILEDLKKQKRRFKNLKSGKFSFDFLNFSPQILLPYTTLCFA